MLSILLDAICAVFALFLTGLVLRILFQRDDVQKTIADLQWLKKLQWIWLALFFVSLIVPMAVSNTSDWGSIVLYILYLPLLLIPYFFPLIFLSFQKDFTVICRNMAETKIHKAPLLLFLLPAIVLLFALFAANLSRAVQTVLGSAFLALILSNCWLTIRMLRCATTAQ